MFSVATNYDTSEIPKKISRKKKNTSMTQHKSPIAGMAFLNLTYTHLLNSKTIF